MNKKEAAQFLGVSEKTIERWKASGRISARMKRIKGDDGKSRQILDFNQSDLERIKSELSNETVFPIVTDRHAQTETQTANFRQTSLDNVNLGNAELGLIVQTQTATLVGAILERLETVFTKQIEASNQAQKLMLTVAEASTLSGLPKSYIKAAIKDGRIYANQIGRTWKIKRTDIEAFVQNL